MYSLTYRTAQPIQCAVDCCVDGYVIGLSPPPFHHPHSTLPTQPSNLTLYHYSLGQVCHSRKICTIKSFPMKQFERRDESKLHSYKCFCWPLTITKITDKQHLNNRFFATFRVWSIPEKISYKPTSPQLCAVLQYCTLLGCRAILHSDALYCYYALYCAY